LCSVSCLSSALYEQAAVAFVVTFLSVRHSFIMDVTRNLWP